MSGKTHVYIVIAKDTLVPKDQNRERYETIRLWSKAYGKLSVDIVESFPEVEIMSVLMLGLIIGLPGENNELAKQIGDKFNCYVQNSDEKLKLYS